MPPQGKPPQQQPWLVSITPPALPPGPGVYQQHRNKGMCWIPTPSQTTLPAPPVYILREIRPSTGIQSLTFPKPRIISFVLQSISFSD